MITSRRTKDGSPVMDIEYTTEVATPHVPWGTPYCGGALKAFFLPSVKGGRDFVELMQRLDVDAVTVTHDRAWDLDKWGFGDFYDRRVKIWEYETVYGYMVDALTSEEWYDVLVMPSVNGWGLWPAEARRAILERVKKGAGLVLVHPFEGEKKAPELSEISPLVGCPNDTVDEGGYAVIAAKSLKSAPWRARGSHFITKNIPVDAICCDELAYYPYRAKGKVIMTAGNGDPVAAVKNFGKGRVAAFGWYNRDLAPQHRGHMKGAGGLSSNSDFWVGGSSKCTWRYVEYVWSMLARAVVWAARRESGVDLGIRAHGGASPSVKVSATTGVEVDASIVNEWGAEEARIITGIEETGGEVSLEMPVEKLSGGVHLANVILRRDGKSVNWGAARFDTPRRAAVGDIRTDKQVYDPGEKVEVKVRVGGADIPVCHPSGRQECLPHQVSGQGSIPQVELEAALVDAFDRVASRQTRKAVPGEEVKLALSRRGVLTPQMWVRVRLTGDGRLLDETRSARLTAVPDYDRSLDDAELVVAQYDRGRGDYVEAVRRQLLEFGATSGYYGYSKLLAQSGAEGGGIYWYDRAPYVARKEKYIRTGDKKHLQRVPCLNDPKFLKEVHDRIVKTAALGARYAPLSYYVQDEGSLTCYRDENDLCFGKHTLAAMRRWLKGEYGDVRALNAEWGTKFTSWAKVVPMTIVEARKHGNLAPWADHRTFMEITFADYFKLVRDSVREVDGDGRIRLSGCQVSEAYTGMDYWRLHQVVEYFEAYGGGNQFEFHQSFAGGRTILGTWIGYGQKGRTSNHKIWNAFFHQIRLLSVFWEFAVVNPDFTLSGSAEDMRDTFRRLRWSGVSKMLFDAERDDSRIAVHYSFPSVHAAYGQVKMERFNSARQGWLNILQDLGCQQSFVSRQEVEAGELVSRRFKVLIMPMSFAVSPREAREIKRFVKAGGRVIGDFQTAVMDDHCKRLAKGALDDVFGIRRYDMRNEPFFINREPMRTKHLPGLAVDEIEEANVVLEEPGVRAAKGKPLFLDDFSHQAPALVVNGYGRGKAAYLNFGADVCAGAGDSAQAKAVKKAVGEILKFFRIKPIVTVAKEDSTPLDRVEVFGYRVPGVRYFALLRENVGTAAVVAYDGIVHGGQEAGAVAEKIAINLPVEGHLYDCLAKEYLGRGDTIDTTIEPAEAKVFAVYPYRINDLDITVEPSGNVVKFSAEVMVSEGKAKEHTIVMEVYDSQGRKSALYSRNIQAKGGRARGKIEFSLEGEGGPWRLVFTEAAGGIRKSVEVMVP